MAIIKSINVDASNLQPAYTALSMGSIPTPTTAAKALDDVFQKLSSNLAAGWQFGVDFSHQSANGMMSPWTTSIVGTAPQCMFDQLSECLNDWQIPSSYDIIEQLCKLITVQISNNGTTGVFCSQYAISYNQAIYYGLAYTTAVVESAPASQPGIIYAFSAGWYSGF